MANKTQGRVLCLAPNASVPQGVRTEKEVLKACCGFC
jgi:hypothetical protein